MTNKMPVVGKRYRLCVGINNFEKPEYVFCDVLRLTDTSVECLVDGLLHYYCKDSFLKGWEELPEDKVNKTTNPVDLEKEEVNEVERALEADKQKGITEQDNKYFQAGWVAARAMFRKANDETKEAMKLLQFQVDNHCKEYINEVDPRFLPPLFIRTLERAKNLLEALNEQFTNNDMSKPEPKIDIQKPSVEPVSIWKDIEALPKDEDEEEDRNLQYLIEWEDGCREICLFCEDEECFMSLEREVYLYNHGITRWATLADFINSFEQMQKDIEELKRK
jgi:hypothetical protein